MSDVSIYKYISIPASDPPMTTPPLAPAYQSSGYSSSAAEFEFVDIQPARQFDSAEKQFKYSRYENFKSRISSLSPSERREYESLKIEFEIPTEIVDQKQSQTTVQSATKSLVINQSKFVEDLKYQSDVLNLLGLEKLRSQEQQLSARLNSKEYLDLLEKYFELLETQSEIPAKDKSKIKRVLQEKKDLRELQSKMSDIEKSLINSEVEWTDKSIIQSQSHKSSHQNIPIRAPYSGSVSESRGSFRTSKKDEL